MSRCAGALLVLPLAALAPVGVHSAPFPPHPADPVPQLFPLGTQPLSFHILAEADDGVEVNDTVWYEDGYAGSGCDRMGAAWGESYDVGLRFHLPDVRRGDTFVYARLVVPAANDGQVDSAVTLRIVGVDQDSPADFSSVRPSQLPKTSTGVAWEITAAWPTVSDDLGCSPLHRYSPDISGIINEIVGRPQWGQGAEGKTLALVIENQRFEVMNFLALRDYEQQANPFCPDLVRTAKLELYPTVRSTFVGKELLGRPTDHSVTVNALSLLLLEVYFEFGTASGVYNESTAAAVQPAGEPIEAVLDGLAPDTRYCYRMRYRRPGEPAYKAGPERSFHTQRAPGEAFTFTIQSDSHLQGAIRQGNEASQTLYRMTLQNALADEPDIHVDLGDTFHSEFYVGRDVLDFEETVERHLDQRPFLDLVCHSAPLFCVLGNHEGEQGWRLDGTPDNLAVWATNARKLFYPNPVPDGFYSGCDEEFEFVGLRENYYAWQWGDALFVVLDPYWHTTQKPHGFDGSDDNWDWTLGYEQYAWLRETLQNSAATFKFVFSHQVTGGVTTYGRGGIEAASHALGGCGSFEWGGEDLLGDYVFDDKRPGWGQPIHQVMVDNNVTIFFHGHDHVFVRQELDGVVYQECPQPANRTYSDGFYYEGRYLSGDMVNNSGHLRVLVSPAEVTVAYIRAYLPGDGLNGEVAYSYTIPTPPGP